MKNIILPTGMRLSEVLKCAKEVKRNVVDCQDGEDDQIVEAHLTGWYNGIELVLSLLEDRFAVYKDLRPREKEDLQKVG